MRFLAVRSPWVVIDVAAKAAHPPRAVRMRNQSIDLLSGGRIALEDGLRLPCRDGNGIERRKAPGGACRGVDLHHFGPKNYVLPRITRRSRNVLGLSRFSSSAFRTISCAQTWSFLASTSLQITPNKPKPEVEMATPLSRWAEHLMAALEGRDTNVTPFKRV